MNINKIKAIIVTVLITIGVSSCTNDHGNATKKETNVSRDQLNIYLDSQPLPVFKTSQLRQNLIEIETAQSNVTVTTSFFFNMGIADPITVCSSVGFPIPASYQLSNPQARMQDHDLTLPQLESNGVYTGDTTGTYVICVDAEGNGYAHYWEGFVATVSGPAKWDSTIKQIVLTGESTAEFTTKG